MRLSLFRTSLLVFFSVLLMASSCGEPTTTDTTLTNPTNFRAEVISETTVKLSWSAVSNATGYSLERKPVGGNYTVIATPDKNTTSYTDTVEAGKTYSYLIKSVRDGSKSVGVASEGVVVPPPGQPFNVTSLEPVWFSKQDRNSDPRNGNPTFEVTEANAVTESGTSLIFTGNAEALYSLSGLCSRFSATLTGSGRVVADETQLWSGSGATGDLPLIGKQQLSLISSGNATWSNLTVTCSTQPPAPNSVYSGGKWGTSFKWGTSTSGLVATHAANLPDGRVISFSAWKELAFGTQDGTYTDRTDGYIWNPGKGATLNTGASSFTVADAGDENQNVDSPTDHDMFCAGLAMLPDGRLFAGGGGSFNNNPSGPAISQFKTSYFDFRTSAWSAGNDTNMLKAHWYGTAVALPDNRVFMVGGGSGGDIAEILNSAGTTWTNFPQSVVGLFPTQADITIGGGFPITAGSPAVTKPAEQWELDEVQQWYPYLNVAPSGKLFQSGPIPKLRNVIIDGNNLTVEPVGSIPPSHAQMRTWGNYVMFDEGKVLVSGGSIVRGHDATNTAMVMDISGGNVNVQTIPNMRFRRSFQNSVILPNGDVLMIGGNNSGKQMADQGFADAPESNPVDAKKRWPSDISTETVLTPEVYSPDKNTWRDLTDMTVPRNYHSVALLLEDGRIVAAGGGLCGDACPTNHPNGQIYEPSYLFNPDGSPAKRPVISSLSVSNNAEGYPRIGYGQQVSVTLTESTSINKFTMVKLSSVTHGINTDLRYLEYSSTKGNLSGSGTSYKLTTSSNRNVLTPGYYFLFALNDKGVPSVAKVVQVL
jgi:hypothetical protein